MISKQYEADKINDWCIRYWSRYIRIQPKDIIGKVGHTEYEHSDEQVSIPGKIDFLFCINNPQKNSGKELPEWAADFDCKSWGQFFLKYLIGHPSVTCVIPGTSKPHHMKDNVAAGFGRLPDQGEREKMKKFLTSL